VHDATPFGQEPAVDLEEVQKTWDEFGSEDPMWAVLTDPSKQGNRWAPEEFFATGVRDIANVLEQARAGGLTPTFRRALDFGCGVGRLTQALAGRFEEVHGVDIAPTMLTLANRFNRHGDRCVFHLNASANLDIFPNQHFDFICSLITLQHLEPRYSAGYLREMLRVLAPGGVFVFQLPSRMARGYELRQFLKRATPSWLAYGYRKVRYGHAHAANPERFAGMEMHALPRLTVTRLLEASAGRVARVVRDRHADHWVSYRYFVTKS
jgi:SAM-dependent methyltransferase